MIHAAWRARTAGIALGVLFSAAAGSAAGQAVTIRVTPDLVQLGTVASEARLRIDGTVAPDAQAVVVIAGKDADETFNRKGRFGPIWVSAGKVHVTGVPSVLLAYSAAPVATFLPRAAVDAARLDEPALARRMLLAPPDADRPEIREHYLALKRDEGTYRFVTDAVRMGSAASGAAAYELDLVWPSTAPPGPYRATVYECRGGAVTGTASAAVEVREVGLAAFMRRFADGHATAYGVMATGLMMGLGFGIDFLVARIRRVRARRSGRPVEARARTDDSVH